MILLNAFKWADKKFGGLDILVNNARADCVTPIIDSKTEEYRRVIDTNLIAPAILAREAVKSMKKCNACGHIINISSLAGLHLEAVAIPIDMYGPSKYGLRALGIELRHEINAAKLCVKITVIVRYLHMYSVSSHYSALSPATIPARQQQTNMYTSNSYIL